MKRIFTISGLVLGLSALPALAMGHGGMQGGRGGSMRGGMNHGGASMPRMGQGSGGMRGTPGTPGMGQGSGGMRSGTPRGSQDGSRHDHDKGRQSQQNRQQNEDGARNRGSNQR